MSIDTSGNVGIATGNLTFSGTGQRITGDFSNATIANRLAFQTSTVNGNTNVYFIPNGTATTAGITYFNSSNISNSSYGSVTITSSSMTINSTYLGTGTYLPITFNTGGSEQVRIGATTGTDLGTVGIGYSTLTGVGTNGLAVAGNVGIGTASPSNKLTVAGNIQVTGAYAIYVPSASSGSNGIIFGADANASSRYWKILDNTSAYGLLDFQVSASNSDASYTSKMVIDSSGNVGIGTNSPSAKLDVRTAAGTAVTQNLYTGSSAAAATLAFGQIGAIQWDTGITASSGNYQIAINTGGTAYTIARTGTVIDYHAWLTSGSERMRIDSSGNVLVGLTITPTSGTNVTNNLVVSNDIALGSLLIGTNASFLGRQSSDGSTILNTGQASIIFSRGVYGSTTTSMTIDSSGNVIAGGSVALATTATNGFLYVPTCAGTPTGTPTTVTGMAPIVVNTTNNKLYFYSGGAWRDAGP
jgi:hypothetical protein